MSYKFNDTRIAVQTTLWCY